MSGSGTSSSEHAWASGHVPLVPVQPAALRRVQRFTLGCTLLALTLGLLGLFDYVWGRPLLPAAASAGITMKANTALALILTALSLLVRVRAPAPSSVARSADLLALLAALLGALTLSEHLFGWSLGIDELLIVDRNLRATTSPGRMGPPAATSFTCLGVALIVLDRAPRWPALPQWLAVFVVVLAGLPVFGYITQASQLYGIARFTAIALPSALALLALALGVATARPLRGPVSVFVADNAGGELARKLLPAAIVLPAAIGWLRQWGEQLGYYDRPFGRALLLLNLTAVFTAVVWMVALRFSSVAAARQHAERQIGQARAEAERLLSENLHTLSVLESLFTHAPLGLMFFDRRGSCVRVNAYVAELHGGKPDELLGQRAEAVLPGRASSIAPALERALHQGASTMDLEIIRPAGGEAHERSWLCGFFPVTGANGDVLWAGCVILESTERRRLEAQRSALLDSERAARSEAERAATLKDEFLATLSHELRTPLNAITGWVAIARASQGLSKELERALEIIERNARLQVKLIEDLLDVSSIVSGKLQLQTQPLDLSSLAQNAVLTIAPQASAKNVEIGVSLPEAAVTIQGDPARIAQIIGNLLSNAVKFTPAGGRVELTVRADDKEVELCVSDTGVGIAPEFLPHVFDRFRQADATTTRRHGGLGLGLAIVRQLAELHGGGVRAESAGEQRGSRFSVRLPLGLEPFAARGARSSLVRVSLAGVRVLVVDDEPDAREFVARVLLDSDASVDTVEGVQLALERMAQITPDVLVSDIGMPGMDGYDLIRRVRALHEARTLPAIALTAFARAEDRRRALSMGFQLHIAKPVDPYELTLAVASLAGRTGTPARPASGEERPAPGAPPP